MKHLIVVRANEPQAKKGYLEPSKLHTAIAEVIKPGAALRDIHLALSPDGKTFTAAVVVITATSADEYPTLPIRDTFARHLNNCNLGFETNAEKVTAEVSECQ